MQRLERPSVWKHDCERDGMGGGVPCDPPCDDPWTANVPDGRGSTFATWAEAMAWVLERGKQ